MAMQSLSLRFVERLVIVLSLVAVSAAPVTAPVSPRAQDPATIALQSWQTHLQKIGWPQQMSERQAPKFLGVLRESVANEHGGMTMTFDGSKPGLLATVTLVLGPAGKPVAKPVVQLADVLEAR